MGSTRRVRLGVPVTALLDAFRVASDSAAVCDALAPIAMRLVDTDDRAVFQRADGATAMLDHLARIYEEQATLGHTWQTSQLFGTAWAEYEVHESLELTLVAICHASIDATVAAEMNDLRAPALLLEALAALPPHLHAAQLYALECLRNLAFVDMDLATLPKTFLSETWETLLTSSESERQEILADILCNLAFHDPTRVLATQAHIAAALSLFFAPSSSATLRLALADLLCNLCGDASYCLLVIYELDERRPIAFKRHSGAVFFADATEKTADAALRQSMEALAHNISWSDPTSKRSVQKLALSRYLRIFAVELAINN